MARRRVTPGPHNRFNTYLENGFPPGKRPTFISPVSCSQGGNLTPFCGGPPAGDPGLGADRKMVGGGRQTDGPDVLIQGDLSVQLHQGNVVVVAAGVVVLVDDDPLHAPLHRPPAGLTLLVQTEEDVPLLRLGVPAPTHQQLRRHTKRRLRLPPSERLRGGLVAADAVGGR